MTVAPGVAPDCLFPSTPVRDRDQHPAWCHRLSHTLGGAPGDTPLCRFSRSRTLSLPGNAGVRDPLCPSQLGNTTIPSSLLLQESSTPGDPQPCSRSPQTHGIPQPLTQLGAAVGVVCLVVPGTPHPLGHLLVALGARASSWPQCQLSWPQCQVATQSPL